MSQNNRVAWTDGMFLLPQHFQQSERSRDESMNFRLESLLPLAWGVRELKLDEASIPQGNFEIKLCRAILPDGTTVDIPANEPAPTPRAFKLDAETSKLEVFLTLPITKQRAPLSTAEKDRADIRFIRREADVSDAHEPARSQPVELMLPNYRIAFSGESLDGLVSIKVAEIQRGSTGVPELNKDFIATPLRLDASTRLETQAEELLAEIVARARGVALKHKPAGKNIVEFTSSDILSFWFLHTLNLHIPTLQHLIKQRDTHPSVLFREFLRLGGGLATFDSQPAIDLPHYDHARAGESFDALFNRLRTLLGRLFQSPFEEIPLQKRDELWTGHITDPELLNKGKFVLIVNAQMSTQQLVEQFPRACKISELAGIEKLIMTFVGGLSIRHLPNPPPAIRGSDDACYFMLQSSGEEWDRVKATGKLALYVPTYVQKVDVKLIGVRPKGQS